MILRFAAALCLGYFFACGTRFGFRTSLLWGWTVASFYFFALSYLSRPWQKIALAPFILYLVFLALFLRKSRGRDAAEPGDAVLVLGSRTDGALPPSFSERRADRAARLPGEIPVIVSGGKTGRETEPEAETLRRLLIARGVAPERIRTESAARITAENFTLSGPLLAGAVRVTVVTHGFHRRRALALAQKALPGRTFSFAEATDETGFLTLHLYLRESFTFLSDLLHGRAAL